MLIGLTPHESMASMVHMTIIKVYREGEIKHLAGAFSLAHALQKAQREAGGKRIAQLRRRGDRLGYTGIGGFVYVNETETEAIDAENAADSRSVK